MASKEATQRSTVVELAMEIVALAGATARNQALIAEHGRTLAGLLDRAPKAGHESTRAA